VAGAALIGVAGPVSTGGAAPEAPALSDAAPVLDSLSKQAQDRSRPEAERVALIEALGQWQTAQVRDPLLALLGDPSAAIRAAAAQGLGWPRNHEAVEALRQRAEAPAEEPAVKAAAVGALGRIGEDSARGLLVASTRDGDAKIREAALRGLTFGPLAHADDRVSFLRQVAKDVDLDLILRCQSIQALAALKDTGSIEMFLDLVEHGPRFPMPRLSDAPSQAEVMLIRFRQARDVKAWTVRALGALDARTAVPLLLKTAEDPDDFFLRMMSVEVLGAWKIAEAVPVLVRRLGDPFEYARVAALWGLGEIGDRGVVDAVIGRLTDREPKVRAQAAKTLGKLGDPKARQQLEIAGGRDPDPDVQQAAAEALAQLTP
jgi:HEAT repeat protein